jgi:C4-dicarboxylate transporter DctM subunit
VGTTALALLFIAGFFILLSTRLPIAFSMGATAIFGILWFLPPKELMQAAMVAYHTGLSSTLIVIPLFIFMAEIVNSSGFAEDLFGAVHRWIGRLPGSLASTTIASCACFASVCGSSVATCATMGLISVPEMLKRGYNKKLVCGATAAGGGLGPLIPPGLGFIVYGMITETSVPKLFMAGIIPGIILSLFYIASISAACTLKPTLAPRGHEKVEWKERFISLHKTIPVLAVGIAVLVSIYFGITTVEEAAGAGAAAAFALALIYRRLSWGKLKMALLNTVRVTGMVFYICFGGMTLSYLVTSLRIPMQICDQIGALSVNPWVIMIAINILYLILGCLLDGLAITLMTIPILFPLVVSLGFDAVWFGLIFQLNMEIGMLTPPVGMNLFVLRSITPKEVTWGDIILGTLPFTLCITGVLILCMIFPQLGLYIPSHMK